MQQDELSFSYDLGISLTTFKPKAAVKALTVAEIKEHLYWAANIIIAFWSYGACNQSFVHTRPVL